jgi:hypothetical protein
MAIPETSLVAQQGGIAQFEGTVQDMALKLNEMKAKIALVNQFFRDIMEKDTDYGIIPGTPKPSLYQPGADKLCSLYNLAKMIVCKDENKNFENGHYDVTVRVQLVHRGSNIVVGELEGSCSTMESKYRYRWVYENKIPRGLDKDSLHFEEFSGKNGSTYIKYRIENEDLFSQWNTVLKMAIKRAYVGCTLSSTGLSGLFTQGEEELEDWINGDDNPGENDRKRQSGGQQKQRQQQSQSQQRQGGSSGKLASEPQKKAIFAISKSKQLNPDEIKALVVLRTGKELADLTSQEASGMIEYLNASSTDDLFQALDQNRDESFDGGAD